MSSIQLAESYSRLIEARDQRIADLLAQLAASQEREAKLQRFKGWVHTYLDNHGVPHHPPGPHGAEGCRIGDRMDWLTAKVAKLEAALALAIKTADGLSDQQAWHDGWYEAPLDKARRALRPTAATSEARHMCGLQGYNPTIGDVCPACESRPTAGEGEGA